MEDALDKDSEEALLVDDETQDVYEGLSSNFFALDRKRGTLLTAPIGTVLQGTIQKVVQSVCKARNIPIDYTFPNLKHVDEWEGAFISSKTNEHNCGSCRLALIALHVAVACRCGVRT